MISRMKSLVAREDRDVAVQRRRAGVSPIDLERAVFLTEVFRPQRLAAGRVERHDLTRAEPPDDNPAVGDGARRREIVLVVYVGERPLRRRLVVPRAAAIGPTVGGQGEGDT